MGRKQDGCFWGYRRIGKCRVRRATGGVSEPASKRTTCLGYAACATPHALVGMRWRAGRMSMCRLGGIGGHVMLVFLARLVLMARFPILDLRLDRLSRNSRGMVEDQLPAEYAGPHEAQ